MHLTENLNVLSKAFPDLYGSIRNIDRIENNKAIRLETTRNGLATIVYESESGPVYLHSKYDPVTEAERFISQYKDMEKYKHVFFYGAGLGYHIEEFCKRWPDKRFSIYEPEQVIMMSFLKEKQLKKLPLANCDCIYTGSSKTDMDYMLHKFANQIRGEVLFIIPPSYERVFSESWKSFMEAFRTALANKKASLQAQSRFQKLWTINSMKNFAEVINSPDILEGKNRYFAGKPAIIVSAGPSLEDELENLRIIKDKGLAYIFSAGSAINTLMSSGIMPHAACAYDPEPNTNEVIRKVKEQGLDIPLIYGSSVYSGTMENYPGPKLHMLTSQDTISSYFLKYKGQGELKSVIDAPSIAVIVLQMLVFLECNPIILAGQNFAFRNNRYYAQGIEYKSRPGALYDVDLDNALQVEDVNGGRVNTSRLFTHMRNQMEMYISHCGHKNIINTTKGGAKIEGTRYKPLEELVEKELAHSAIDNEWLKEVNTPYDIDYMISRGKSMIEEKDSAERLIAELIDTLDVLKSEIKNQLLQKSIKEFEQAYNKLVANHYFSHVLRSMNRVQFEIAVNNISDIASIKDVVGKARLIAEIFDDAFRACYRDMNLIKYDFCDMVDEIMENDIKVMSFTVKTC